MAKRGTTRPYRVDYAWMDQLPTIRGCETFATEDRALAVMDQIERSARRQERPVDLTLRCRGEGLYSNDYFTILSLEIRPVTTDELTKLIDGDPWGAAMTEDEAVEELRRIRLFGGSDAETAHHHSDAILLAMVPARVREAYEAVAEMGFWYA